MNKETSEIAKLTERISKDPKSKLFVPLAEEYKKAGDVEMSIYVLQEGLKNNPSYVTARSFLGRLLVEQGDFSAAQKEFEEVVKAIPDNLMAHRKLGDIYALQDRAADATKHYKTVLSLNAKDPETAMLLSELEAGRDIKKHLARPKPAATEVTQKKEGVSPAAFQPRAAAMARTASPVSSQTGITEVAEEVFVVEPLDEPEPPPRPQTRSLDQELAANNLGFLSETDQEPIISSEPGEVSDEEAFSFGAPGAGSKKAEGFDDESLRTPPVPVQQPEKQADDFTTDTLAELYISQGFYEKAVDIYERMLVDNPNSQGLKQKLAHVRAMAAAAPVKEEAAEDSSFEIPSAFDSGLDMPAAPAGRNTELDAFVPPPQAPAGGDWDMPAEDAIPAFDDEVPSKQSPRHAMHFEVGFEPREYVPPDAVLKGEQAGSSPVEQRKQEPGAIKPPQDAGKPVAGNQAAVSRKDTIERLESWLKHIKKES
jgi:tetratricopeptide (TPR) repeat protein